MNHFDEMTGVLYLEGQLDGSRAQEFKAHLSSCDSCRRLLHALDQESIWLREALTAEEEPLPASVIASPRQHSSPWAWIVPLGLGIGGAYTLWSGFISPWLGQAAQAGFAQGDLLTMLFFSGAFWEGWGSVLSLMGFLAVATLGAVLIWFLRRHFSRNTTTYAVVMSVAVLCALGFAPAASATEVEHGNPNYTLPAGQEVKTDLVVFASRARIDGDVDGDLIVWSQNILVTGHVKGDVIAFGQHVRIDGAVDGNVRTGSQVLTLNGSVARNLMTWSQSVELDEKSKVGGSVTMAGADMELNGQTGGDVLTFGGRTEINGALGGDADIHTGQLQIGPTASIQGKTKFVGGRPPDVSQSAKLGTAIETEIQRRGPDYASPGYYWGETLFWGASFLLGFLLILIAPGFYFDGENASNKVGLAMGTGFLTLLAVPIAAVIACFTIVGIGVGVVAILLWIIAIYAAQIFVGAWLGEKILGAKVGVGPAAARLALGLAIIHAVRMIPVPFERPLIGLVVTAWGLGALSLAIYKNVRPQVAIV
jgi:cytoskeletal protein CcmA (bactofilin family)